MMHYLIRGVSFELSWDVAHTLINAGCFLNAPDDEGNYRLNPQHSWTTEQVVMLMTGERA